MAYPLEPKGDVRVTGRCWMTAAYGLYNLGAFRKWEESPEWPRTHLILELLAELQGDGEVHQGIVEPGDHTFYLVYVAHLEAL